ncbi:hypothetical protein [Capnocytophaga leadbetteri]|uniref:hypothetical protein n=1 Tax=Capnocytophaga leadbetteri TaxID=327575 RepID=UPI002889B56F|nr:hypothetical protein [Capnocytophaga leadbetteri]
MGHQSKIELYYFVFDDENQQKDLLIQTIKISGCNCNLIFINPKDYINEQTGSFDKETFKSKVIDESQGKEISLIATDWNLINKSDKFNGICGWDIIELVIEAKQKLENKRFLIYSGNIRNVSKFIAEKIRENGITERLPIVVEKLLKLRIKICSRNSQIEEILSALKDANTISSIVLNTIQSFGEHKMHNMGNDYDGNKIVDILKSEEADIFGLKFIREIIELAIAKYTDLQIDDK